jgi:hypothetical protein
MRYGFAVPLLAAALLAGCASGPAASRPKPPPLSPASIASLVGLWNGWVASPARTSQAELVIQGNGTWAMMLAGHAASGTLTITEGRLHLQPGAGSVGTDTVRAEAELAPAPGTLELRGQGLSEKIGAFGFTFQKL